MNVQLANLSFLVLLCSMICYWIGPLSRDLFGNTTTKKIIQKDNEKNPDGFSPSGFSFFKYDNSSKEVSKDNSENYPQEGKNISLKSAEGLSGSFLTSSLRTSSTSERDLRSQPGVESRSYTSALLAPETNSSMIQKTYSPSIGEFVNNIGAQMVNLKFSVNVSRSLQFLGHSGIILANILLIILLSNRWIESGHFPLSNLYESLMFLSWSFTSIHLFLENLINYQPISNQSVGKFIGAITTPSALFTNAFATFTLPKEMQASSSLVPALQSNWLMMHVTVMIISYAALILGSLLSIAYLIITIKPQSKETHDIENTQKNLASNSRTSTKTNTLYKSNKSLMQSIALTLDNLSYRILGIGFPFLTIGILSGAVWANEAWGSYWSWDPKETWAFLTWLVYAIYLHTRLNKGWAGQKPAIIASLGFIVTWICYLGVNLIGEGLHSYGWIIK